MFEYVNIPLLIIYAILLFGSIMLVILSSFDNEDGKLDKPYLLIVAISILIFFIFLSANDIKKEVNKNIIDFKDNKTLICKVNHISYRVSKPNKWKLDIIRKSFFNDIYNIDAKFCKGE